MRERGIARTGCICVVESYGRQRKSSGCPTSAVQRAAHCVCRVGKLSLQESAMLNVAVLHEKVSDHVFPPSNNVIHAWSVL
jgi:hypothetical protein